MGCVVVTNVCTTKKLPDGLHTDMKEPAAEEASSRNFHTGFFKTISHFSSKCSICQNKIFSENKRRLNNYYYKP